MKISVYSRPTRAAAVLAGRLLVGLLVGLLVLAAGAAEAQPYPSRAVRIVIPYAAGGAVDTTARLLQPGLQQALGETVLIDNRSGANGVIGAALVAKAPSDGYTLMIDLEAHAVTPA